MKLPRVLYAEDDKDTFDLFATYLNRRGFEVKGADSVAKCLEIWHCAETRLDPLFDAIIVDQELSDGSGLDLCRHIRSRNAAMPIFMYSGFCSPDDEAAALDSGATGFFAKPLGFLDLVSNVETACTKNKRQTV